MGFSPWTGTENTVHDVETNWLSSKQRFRAVASGKKVRLIVSFDMKWVINIDSLEKRATLNNAS